MLCWQCVCTLVLIVYCRYWVGVVQLSVAMGDKRQALMVLLCLKDLSLFINQQKWGESHLCLMYTHTHTHTHSEPPQFS